MISRMSYSHPGPPRTLPRRAPLKKSTHADRKKKRLGRADSAPLQEVEDGELRTAAKRAGVEVVQHIAKLYWFGVDQMRVERTVKLSIGVRDKGCGKWTGVVWLWAKTCQSVMARSRCRPRRTPASGQTRSHVKSHAKGPRWRVLRHHVAFQQHSSLQDL